MIRLVQRFIALAAAFCVGCATDPPRPVNPVARTIFVPGVFGDNSGYNGLRRAIAAGGFDVSTHPWGFPKPLFVANFSGQAVHDKAEAELAAEIDQTTGPLHLVGHSAGCGVILGALGKTHRQIDRVVLIAPSVSPGYDVSAALEHSRKIDVFYSDRDTVFLKWRCGTFGTYDRVKTPAAGYAGFATTRPSLVQHAYDPAWDALGNDGSHGGGTAERFVRSMVLPLLAARDDAR
ncbi:MAG: alpha/beta fold hydrolase [Tepidisphaeraceae bacterium]